MCEHRWIMDVVSNADPGPRREVMRTKPLSRHPGYRSVCVPGALTVGVQQRLVLKTDIS